MRVYVTAPIDDWTGWHTPEAITAQHNPEYLDEGITPERWQEQFRKAQELAQKCGWEGDFREGPFVSMLPQQDGHYGFSPFLIGWKQDNDGHTFIISPFELPWLSECEERPE